MGRLVFKTKEMIQVIEAPDVVKNKVSFSLFGFLDGDVSLKGRHPFLIGNDNFIAKKNLQKRNSRGLKVLYKIKKEHDQSFEKDYIPAPKGKYFSESEIFFSN